MSDFVGLTEDLCSVALDIVRPAIETAMDTGTVKRKQGVLVVLDPTKPWEPKYEKADGSSFDEVVLFAHSWTDGREFDAPFSDVAAMKAFASWKTGLPAHRIQQEAPYLYQPGWTKWGGSAVGDGGLVVAFSGVQWYFDQMFSEMMLAAIKAVCLDEMLRPGGVMDTGEITFLGDRTG